MTQATILLADDDASIRTVLTQYLQQQGFIVKGTDSASALWDWVQAGLGDVVISDVVMPDADGLDLLPKLRDARPDLPVIIMSAKNTVLTALKASERGAFDYLPKPFDLQDLAETVRKALQGRQTSETPAPTPEVDLDLPIVGSSGPMQAVYRLIGKVAPTDLSIMIRGESGTGKELVAKVLHEFGPRRLRPFVALNMAAIPADLVESELFGHERGAFTGADSRKEGRFAQAEGGTLFLDEIGDMPLSTQTRLLRVLQEGTYTRIGGLEERRTNVRIIAATHRDLEAMVASGAFRQDLFYRLNVVPLNLPPLRERLEDLAELVPALINGLGHGPANSLGNRSGRGSGNGPGRALGNRPANGLKANGLKKAQAHTKRPAKTFTAAALSAMAQYSWPGNVRELENFIQRLLAVLPQSVIDAPAVEDALDKARAFAPPPLDQDRRMLPDEALHAALAQFFKQEMHTVPTGQIYAHFLEMLERPLFEHMLKATRGNQIQAATLLGLNRNTLRKKVKELGIRVVRGHGALQDKTASEGPSS